MLLSLFYPLFSAVEMCKSGLLTVQLLSQCADLIDRSVNTTEPLDAAAIVRAQRRRLLKDIDFELLDP